MKTSTLLQEYCAPNIKNWDSITSVSLKQLYLQFRFVHRSGTFVEEVVATSLVCWLFLLRSSSIRLIRAEGARCK